MPQSNKPRARYSVPAAGPDKPHITHQLIRKSRFTAHCCRCQSEEQAKEFIAKIRAQHPDATHNCWAYQTGAPGQTAHVGSSDDGEPKGTAGRPMLNALVHCGTGEICVVVSRWFGGIKLGTGGLVRAYQGSVLDNLASLPLAYAISAKQVMARFDYKYLALVHQLLTATETAVVSEKYNGQVRLTLKTPEDRLDELKQSLAELTNGSAAVS